MNYSKKKKKEIRKHKFGRLMSPIYHHSHCIAGVVDGARELVEEEDLLFSSSPLTLGSNSKEYTFRESEK